MPLSVSKATNSLSRNIVPSLIMATAIQPIDPAQSISHKYICMVAGHESQTWKLMLWFGRHKHGGGIGSGMRANAINSSNGFCSLKDEGAAVAGCGRSTTTDKVTEQ